MNANTLTVIVGIAGILASYLFFWLGVRKAKAQNFVLRDDIQQAQSVNQILLEQIAVGRPNESGRDIVTLSPSPDAPLSDVAIEELLRISLGALLDERGDVDMTRLMREIAAAVGPRHLTDAMRVLSRLRQEGRVSWEDGDDPADVRTLHVMLVQRPDDESRLRSGGTNRNAS